MLPAHPGPDPGRFRRPVPARQAGTMTQTAATPFAQPPAGTPGAWIAGLAFGLVCIAVALVVLTTVAVVALARAAWHLAPSLAWPTGPQRRPSPLPARPHSYAMITA
jgi:hypothetical protein